MPQAVPRRPPASRRTRTSTAARPTGLAGRSTARTAAPEGSSPSRATSTGCCHDLPRPGGGRGAAALPAPRDRAGHLRQLPQRGQHRRARSRRSASPRSARASATRSPRATSSSARASSSRWRWSSSSSPAPTRSGTSTGSKARWDWYVDLGLKPENLRFFEHPKEKLSHYSKRTVDIEYRFTFGGSEFAELEGIANRTDFDLTHPLGALRGRPVLLRPGVRRALGAVRHRAGSRAHPVRAGVPARRLRRGRGAQRQGRRRQAHGAAPRPAPGAGQGRRAAAVAQRRPLAGRPDLAAELRRTWNVDFDDAGAIGRRYRRQDEIGTPFCVTVDFDTLNDQAVTVRERDSMAQERIPLAGLADVAERAPAGVLSRVRGAADLPLPRAPWSRDHSGWLEGRQPGLDTCGVRWNAHGVGGFPGM